MSEVVRCEPWYDKSWWEAQLPESWTFSRDTSIKGWPYIFESPRGARLIVHASKSAVLSGWNFALAPADLSEEQKKAFLLAASDASALDAPKVDITQMSGLEIAMLQHQMVMRRDETMQAATRRLQRQDLGTLVGFTYSIGSEGKVHWCGHFSSDPYMVYTVFTSSAEAASDSASALSVLASLQFRRPNYLFQPTG